ncbi:MAG: hypothetical protein AAB541_03600 [Patescibacteria group bacterium]
MNRYKKVAFALLLPILMLAVGVPVLADDSDLNSGSNFNEAAKKEAEARLEAAKQEVEKKREAAKQKAEKLREAAKDKAEQHKEKLKEDKLKICQEREDGINSSMAAVAARGQAKLNLFTKIAERTEAFYVSKGKVLANYDNLVAAVTSKKAAAQAAVDSVGSSNATFKCDGDDPKGTAREFKTKVKSMNEALKGYRTAVKNLIVGVKSVQGTTASEGSR